MPHRVADFLRSAENFSALTISIKSTVRQQNQQRRKSRSPARPAILRNSSSSANSVNDSEEIPYHQMYSPDSFLHPKKREEKKEKGHSAKSHHPKILALPFGGRKESVSENPHASLAWNIESPPIVFYGPPESSTGALVSGQISLEVKDETFDVDSFSAALNIHVHHKKPFTQQCTECADQYTELKNWTFLGKPTSLSKGTHQFPFSILLDGHLPATMDSPVLRISYEFKAEVTPSPVQLAKMTHAPTKGSALPIRLERFFDVKRSIPAPESPHHSVRVFPPTNIKTDATYSHVIHPAGRHRVQLRLDGLTRTNTNAHVVEFWKLKKVTWKLQETIKTVAPACKKHSPAGAEDEAPAKGVTRTETRTLGEKQSYHGWKSDFSSAEGKVDFEFDYGISSSHLASGHSGHRIPGIPYHSSHGPGYACDTRSHDGTEVSHILLVEMVVSKEWSPVGKPHLATQTGTGRILRMQYGVILTDTPGMGVSWDNESPPVYQDVPPSPPQYFNETACPIEYESLEPLDGRGFSPEPVMTGGQDSRRTSVSGSER